ncbi:tripartite motif-containing protein 3-like [Amphiura filiformis]|uniref:tripartite motif-containing protein 3-like n=1 Tax=Amphiura filiformis TaxID=82378 RepID=UPI003B20D056
MASMPSFQSRKQEEFKEEFLTCPICAESYDDSKHKAKCLPCLHSFCASCLQRYIKERKSFACPKCRQTVQLETEGDLSSLPNNFIVENLKEYHDIFNLCVPCGNCDDGENAVSFCHDCVCFVCQGCVDMHQKMRSLRGHSLSTMTELREKKCNPMSLCQQRCEKHPKQEMTLYCQDESCKVPVCPTCAHVEHRGHDLVYIEVTVEKTTEELQGAAGKVRAQLEELTLIKTAIKQAQSRLMLSFRQKETEMQGTVEELHRMIDLRKEEACTKMDDLFKNEEKRLEEYEKSVDMLSFQMSSACEYTESSCSINHHVQLLDSSRHIMQRLQELQSTPLPMAEIESKEFVVSEKHVVAMGQFQDSIKNLCDLTLVVSKSPTSESFSSPDVEFPPPPKINFATYEEGSKSNSNESSVEVPPQTKTPSSEKTKKLSGKNTKKPPAKKVVNEPPQPAVDTDQCTITLDPNPWRGKPCKAEVTTVNSDNKPIPRGGAKVQASLKWAKSQMGGLPCPVVDHDNGTYTITYTPLLYGDNELAVYINDTSMEGSPFIVIAGQENS